MYARDQAILATPIGAIRLIAIDGQLLSLTIEPTQPLVAAETALLKNVQIQLDQWFLGERKVFDLPLLPVATVRGQALRDGIIDIGYGETSSYGALARQIASSARAIGQACARNPLPIIVPCHRVLSAGNVLGAYSGGNGPKTKAWLLAHEQRHRPAPAGQLDYTIA
ncbi:MULTISPECIES: methylated-DNA--[protein]-cysteine S-methyltransferase [unclassified Sphingomonas]|uniref:methylated-DNA--[protein]-cysteine S-methyltransferase n=1 Tax=unclassified Sphingomonas TaxID=196159 RepID=UPI000BD3FBDF|nr:MAG: cysteine methyltransferase [Sphingomonas sp. 12-62-6]OYX38754.1 MAG: cysteine methyltransferase [Sphingomonas sp. 32-62-10]OYY64673.1 MAG: cysteine methyltransferase [Sphingomonas sp. 28-62-11]